MSVTSGGRQRTFILHVPSTRSGAAQPLVLVYHGAGDTAAATEQETDLAQVADARGELVAFLQGYDNTWNEGAGHTPAEQAGVDDVAFTAAALSAIKAAVPVDSARVAAVGFSNGALMVEYLGCRLAASLTLIVPVAGPLPVSVASSCAPARPVSVLAVHGTADDSIPYDGGSFAGVGGGTTVLSATSSIARWAALDGCSASAASTTQGSIRLSTYQGCQDGASVTLRSLIGAGHAWPADIGELVAQALGG